MKIQLIASTTLMVLLTIPTIYVLPEEFHFYKVFRNEAANNITCIRWKADSCVSYGLWSGLIIGYVSEIYTSNAYSSIKNLAEACRMGTAPHIILGLAL